jgi:hypothetical protein
MSESRGTRQRMSAFARAVIEREGGGRLVAGLLPVLFAAACTTHAPDPRTAVPSAGEGVVIVALSNNVYMQAPERLVIARAGQSATSAGAQHSLRQVTSGFALDTTLFMGIVPAGRYQFASFELPAIRRRLDFQEGSNELLGSFAVRSGEVSDLGRLVLAQLGQGLYVGRSNASQSNSQLLERYFPELASKLGKNVFSGWNGPRSPTDDIEARALSIPGGAFGMLETSAGEVIAGSRLGTVVVRGKEGGWTQLRTGELDALYTVFPVETDRTWFLAGGEMNGLWRADRSGKLQRIPTGNLPPGSIRFITGRDRLGWVAALEARDTVTFFRTESLEEPNWRELRSVSVAGRSNFGIAGISHWTTPSGFGYVAFDGPLWFYDFASDSWIERQKPQDDNVFAASLQVGSQLMLTLRSTSTRFLSRDMGQTWRPIPVPSVYVTAYPTLLPSGRLLVGTRAPIGDERALSFSDDDGKTWQRAPRALVDGEQLIAFQHAGLFAYSAFGGSAFAIRRSVDQGQTWITEVPGRR